MADLFWEVVMEVRGIRFRDVFVSGSERDVAPSSSFSFGVAVIVVVVDDLFFLKVGLIG